MGGRDDGRGGACSTATRVDIKTTPNRSIFAILSSSIGLARSRSRSYNERLADAAELLRGGKNGDRFHIIIYLLDSRSSVDLLLTKVVDGGTTFTTTATITTTSSPRPRPPQTASALNSVMIKSMTNMVKGRAAEIFIIFKLFFFLL